MTGLSRKMEHACSGMHIIIITFLCVFLFGCVTVTPSTGDYKSEESGTNSPGANEMQTDWKEIYEQVISEYRAVGEAVRSLEFMPVSLSHSKEYLAEHFPGFTDAGIPWFLNTLAHNKKYYWQYAEDPEDLGWVGVFSALYDVNKDGLPELIISCQGQFPYYKEDGSFALFSPWTFMRQVYTIREGKAVPLFDDTRGLNEYVIFVHENSLFFEESYLEKMEHYTTEYELSRNGELVIVDQYVYDAHYDKNPDKLAVSDKRSVNISELTRELYEQSVELDWKEIIKI